MKIDPQVFVPTEIRPGVVLPVYTCPSGVLGVVRDNGSRHLVAIQRVPVGATLLRIDGILTQKATRYSVQVGEDSHIDMAAGGDEALVLSRYYWRFTNHSCEPNTQIQSRDVIAAREIKPWEAVTFNYNTTEYDMAEPFACHCGAASCIGMVRGARHLTAEQLEMLRPSLAPYLLRLLASSTNRGSS